MPRKSTSLLCVAILANAGCGRSGAPARKSTAVDQVQTKQDARAVFLESVEVARALLATDSEAGARFSQRHATLPFITNSKSLNRARDWRKPSKPWSRIAERFNARCFRRV